MPENTQRFPLSWPVGWPRTPRHQRKRASFRSRRVELSVFDALRRLSGELSRLRATHEVLSTNVVLRIDGLPRSGQPEPADPGAAVYFKLKDQDRCLACDRWLRVADNIAAIAQHIDALRRIDRYGVGTLDQAFAGYTALPAKGATWRTTLGFPPDARVDKTDVDKAFRDRARDVHPDAATGSHDAMASLTQARVEAYRELEAR